MLRKLISPALWLRLLVLAAGVAGVIALANWKPPKSAPKPKEKTWPVETVAIAAGDFAPTHRLFGTVVVRRTVNVRAQVAGSVIALDPALIDGGTLNAGEQLVEIDAADHVAAVREQRAAIDEAEAELGQLAASVASDKRLLKLDREDLKRAEVEADRIAKLLAAGNLSQRLHDERLDYITGIRRRFEERQRALSVAEAQRAGIEARLARLQQNLAKAENALQKTIIRAPFDGVVSEVQVAIGQPVMPGDLLARIYDHRDLELKVHLPDRIFADLQDPGGTIAGRPVTLLWRSGGTARRIAAVIDRSAGLIDRTSGGVHVFVRAETALPPGLRPGAFVDLEITGRSYAGVSLLPPSALYDGHVYVVGADDRLRLTRIELVADVAEGLVVRTDLAPGTRILKTRFAQAADGLLVKPF